MSLVDRLLGRPGKGPPQKPQVDLAELVAWLAKAVARSGDQPADPDLVRSRLADRCRDAGLEPLLPEEFAALAEGLDAQVWRRLALLVGTLDLEALRATLAALAGSRPLRELVAAAFVGVAREMPLLTLELLRLGPLRVEELARRFLERLGAGVQGESADVSRRRLQRLDYRRLLAEAERAKVAAADRMNQLRKLQDEQEKTRPPRGKW